jgi:cell division septation protein DedD
VTLPTVRLAELPFQLPDLAQNAAVIALIPADGGADWAPAMAWTVARAAATLGRRTLLVDCFVDAPRLHTVVGAANDEGIVDAFEYGASLTHIAQRQSEPGLFFVPAGTFASDPSALMANPRWSRLAAGFRHEGALLLLYTSSAALPFIISETDAAVILAPDGYDFDRDAAGGLVEALQSGRPVVVVVPGAAAAPDPGPRAAAARPAPPPAGVMPPDHVADHTAPAAQGAPEEGSGSRASIKRTRPPFKSLDAVRGPPPRTRRAIIYFGVLVVAAVLALVAVRPEWVLPAPTEEEALAPARTARRTGSLPWMVQVSAWDSLAPAFAEMDTLRAHGVYSIVTPVRIARGIVYRIHAGPLADKSAADWLLDSLRAARRADPVGSIAVQVPLSFHFDSTAMDRRRATALRDSLRAAGIATFVLAQSDGRVHLYAGAFENRDEAALLDSLLHTLGRAGRLGVRVGHRP